MTPCGIISLCLDAKGQSRGGRAVTRDEHLDDDVPDAGTETCKVCGSMYHVTLNRGQTRMRDWYNCAVCGQMLMEWDSNETPCFTLIGSRYLRKPR